MDCWGPVEGRHADGYMLNVSKFLERLDSDARFKTAQHYWLVCTSIFYMLTQVDLWGQWILCSTTFACSLQGSVFDPPAAEIQQQDETPASNGKVLKICGTA